MKNPKCLFHTKIFGDVRVCIWNVNVQKHDCSVSFIVLFDSYCADWHSKCEFVGANPYLTFHCSSQGTVLVDLAPDDKEFQSVEEEVCNTFTYTT